MEKIIMIILSSQMLGMMTTEKDEVYWLQEELNGVLVHVQLLLDRAKIKWS